MEEVDALLVSKADGTLDFENTDQTKLAELAVSVVQEQIDDIGEEMDWQKKVNEASLIRLLFTKPFIEIYFMSLSSVLLGLFVIGSSKAYGQLRIKNESLLTIAATLSNIFNIFRFVWSFALERIGYKKIYFILLVI